MTTTTTHADIEAIEKRIMELKAERTRLRRSMTPEPVEDYTLTRPDGVEVRLSELFAGDDELLLVHNMGRSCSYCTLWADGLNGLTDHLTDRAAFVLTSPDEPRVLGAFAASRGWRFPVASVAGTTLAEDLGFRFDHEKEGEAPGYWPGVSALRKTDNAIVRTGWSFFGPGDDFCALWPMTDLLPETKWHPKFAYGQGPGARGGADGCGCG